MSPTSSSETYERVTPRELPFGCGIEILDDSPDRLRFRVGMGKPSMATRIVPLFLLAFAIGHYSFLASTDSGLYWTTHFGLGTTADVLLKVYLFLVGLIPLGIGLYGFWGSTTVELTREWLSCRSSLGPIGYTTRLPAASIEAIGIERSNRQNAQSRGPQSRESVLMACIARAGGRWIGLTFCQDEFLAGLVASLVRTRLEELGHPVS